MTEEARIQLFSLLRGEWWGLDETSLRVQMAKRRKHLKFPSFSKHIVDYMKNLYPKLMENNVIKGIIRGNI
jgi:hypothetical protein